MVQIWTISRALNCGEYAPQFRRISSSLQVWSALTLLSSLSVLRLLRGAVRGNIVEVYSRSHVTVDDNFARFGAKSYAINKITSVEVRKHERHKSGWLFFAIFGGLILIVGLGQLTKDGGQSAATIALGALMLVPAYFLHRSRVVRSFELFLATAAGEVQATKSENGDAIEELRQAIELRIVQHGSLRA